MSEIFGGVSPIFRVGSEISGGVSEILGGLKFFFLFFLFLWHIFEMIRIIYFTLSNIIALLLGGGSYLCTK